MKKCGDNLQLALFLDKAKPSMTSSSAHNVVSFQAAKAEIERVRVNNKENEVINRIKTVSKRFCW